MDGISIIRIALNFLVLLRLDVNINCSRVRAANNRIIYHRAEEAKQIQLAIE